MNERIYASHGLQQEEEEDVHRSKQMDTRSGLSQLRSEGLLLGIRHLIEHSLEILLGVLRVDLVLQPLELLRTPTASSASARERATRGRGALTIFSAIWSICSNVIPCGG